MNFFSSTSCSKWIACLATGAMLAIGVAAQEPQTVAPGSTLTVNARLVVLDVVVVDKSGKLVTNLGREKFAVYEDKVPQTMKDFEPPSAHPMPAGSTTKAVVNNAADLSKIGTAPVNVLVFDELNTPFNQLAYARQQMEKYLQSLPEVLPVPTLFVAAGNKKMAVLHDYTQNRAELLDSVKKHTADVDFTQMLANLNGGKSGNDYGLEQTLGALTQIAEAVQGVPGRKNVIWIGKGYNNALDLQNLSQADRDRALAAIRQVTDKMLAARVTLNVVDPEGPAAADTATIDSIDPTAVGSPGTQVGDFGDNMGFYQFSTETGGRVVTGRNDLNAQFGELTLEGTEYYTLTYAPTSANDASRPYRRIRVVVNDPNLRVMTRDGYFAGVAAVSAVALAPKAKQAKDVQFDLMSAARTTMAYTGLHVAAQPMKNGFNLIVNANDLKFVPQDNGTRIAEVTIVAVCYNKNGKETSQHAAELKQELSATDVIRPNSNVAFVFPMVVPAFTDHVRFVMRDAATGTLGSADGKP